MKKIYINENQLHLLEQKEKEVTFYEFFINVKSFLKDLLKKPSEANIGDLLSSKGITKDELLRKMKNINLIKSDERIDEIPVPMEEEKKTHPYGTKLVSKHYVKYSIPRERFEKKVKEISASVLDELFKILWQRNSFWKNSVKN